MASDDLASLVKSLDLPAKVHLLTGASAFALSPEPSIGLGELRFSDGPTGVRGPKFSGGRVVSLFPNATLLASAWDEQAGYEVGQLLAEEAMAQEIHVVLGPTINLHRSVLGGRLFEAYSEDPLLTGKLAAAYVRGLQDSGIAACLKHLVANESETDRNTMNSVVDEATLRELYLLPFEMAADAWSIMAAYNDVNGVAATEQHHVLNEIVKGEWGYRGLVMSDWFATKTAAPAANGGLDLVMPGPSGPGGAAPPRVSPGTSRRAGRSSSASSGPAPGRSRPATPRRRSRCGPPETASARRCSRHPCAPFPAPLRPAPPSPRPWSSPRRWASSGSSATGATRSTVDVLDEAVRAAASADVAVVVVGLTEEQETESADKSTLRLPGAQDALVEAVAGAARRTVVVVNAATPVLMPWLSRVDAVLWAGLPGQEGGHAVAAALLGDIEPAGRLVTTFPAADEAAPAWSVTPAGGDLPYTEGTFIGYRGHFAGRAPAPAFWLGHGLGYGRWEYSDVSVVPGDSPAITATVTNTGTRTSREVVQVYWRPAEPDEPTRLVGWAAATVGPGASARVTVGTDPRLWRKWDTAASAWTRLAGGGEFLVARGLGDIRAVVS